MEHHWKKNMSKWWLEPASLAHCMSRPTDMLCSRPRSSAMPQMSTSAPSLQDLPLREADFYSLIASIKHCLVELQAFFHHHQYTSCLSPVCKRPNSSWTPPSRCSQAMPPTDTIAHPEVVVVDLYSPPLCPLHDAWWWHSGSSSSRDRLRGNHIDLCQCLNPSCVLLPLELLLPFLMPFFMKDQGDQMVHGDFNTHHPSWFSRTWDDRAAARGESLEGWYTAHNLLLQTKFSLLSFPWAIPPHQISPYWVGISSLIWHGSTLNTLGSDHLPITVTLSSHPPPLP